MWEKYYQTLPESISTWPGELPNWACIANIPKRLTKKSHVNISLFGRLQLSWCMRCKMRQRSEITVSNWNSRHCIAHYKNDDQTQNQNKAKQ